jgi:type IV pilus assembly protein PilW
MRLPYKYKNAPLFKDQQGLTLVELMVALIIALFLMGGLATLLMNTRAAFGDQNKLAVLQDNARMALTMINNVIQQGGYFPDPTVNTAASVPTPFAGTYSATAPGDTISVAYMTAPNDTILNCSGTSNTTTANVLYINSLSVSGGQLVCAVDIGGTETEYALVSGLQNMQIQYGVKANTAAPCANCVDTYMNATQVGATTNWANVISVVVTLTFDNPLYSGPGDSQPQTISFRRVTSVMGKVGIVL